MKYEEALNGTDGNKCKVEFDNKHEQMVKHKVWEVDPRLKVPKGIKPIDSTFACKKKRKE